MKTSHINQRAATSFSIKSNVTGGDVLYPVSERSNSAINKIENKTPNGRE